MRPCRTLDSRGSSGEEAIASGEAAQLQRRHMTTEAKRHPWRFHRNGGFDQVVLKTGADLLALGSLDQKLWVALACPTSMLEFDSRTLRLLDVDGDGRVRAPEVIAGAQWAGAHLVDPEELAKCDDRLTVSMIKADAPEGVAIQDAANALLKTLGKPPGDALTVEDTAGAVDALFKAPFNGDGVITHTAAPSEPLKQCVRDIIACVGATEDRSKAPGVDQQKVDQFFTDLAQWSAWRKQGEGNAAVFPDETRTVATRDTLRKLETKVDDYFARCRMAAFDPRAASAMNRDEKDYVAMASRELRIDAAQIAEFPLSHIAAARPLPLTDGLNPAWADAVAKLKADIIQPLFGELPSLTEAQWANIKQRYAAFDAWMSQKQGASVEKLGGEQVEAYLSSDHQQALTKLIEEDLALQKTVTALGNLEKLARLRRDLMLLANNFVSFRDFYSRKALATFQAGKLYIDQRSLDLVLRVEDAGKHAVIAALARTYILYCECRRDGQKLTIAAAVTDGESDNLMVGRNGVFYDRQGRDWDATITRIVDNPISVRQAFWAPYKKLLRFIEEQIARRATEADNANTARMTGTAEALGKAGEGGATPPPEAKKFDIGIVAALGVAVGGIAAAMGAMMQAFFGLGAWMPLGFLALVLAVSCPSMAIAWLKLRQRNLAPLLDANGWAMNSPGRINLPFGRALTQLAVLPRGAARELRDPFAEPNRPWATYGAVAAAAMLAAFWFTGKADKYLPDSVQKAQLWAAKPTTPPAEAPPAAPPAAPLTKTATETAP